MPDPSASEIDKSEDGLNRILVASDLTAYSDRAFDRAVILAEENHAALRFLHAIEPGASPKVTSRETSRKRSAIWNTRCKTAASTNALACRSR